MTYSEGNREIAANDGIGLGETSAGHSAGAQFRNGLAQIEAHYDTYLVDQWGVLHDGQSAYPGAVDCLRRLMAAGKRVIICSNSGKRAADNAARLQRFGVDTDCYTELVTSGEVAWHMLRTGSGGGAAFAGKRCLLLQSDADANFAEGLPLPLVEQVAEAEFILLAGVDDTKPPEFYRQVLDAAAQRGLPMLCANPDLTRLTPQGLQPGAGALAWRYEVAGGRVSYVGKPYPDIYAHCLRRAGGGRALAVGDSLHHDVAGGHAAGIDTLLVLGGVHAEEFRVAQGPVERLGVIRDIVGADGAIPDWVLSYFRW